MEKTWQERDLVRPIISTLPHDAPVTETGPCALDGQPAPHSCNHGRIADSSDCSTMDPYWLRGCHHHHWSALWSRLEEQLRENSGTLPSSSDPMILPTPQPYIVRIELTHCYRQGVESRLSRPMKRLRSTNHSSKNGNAQRRSWNVNWIISKPRREVSRLVKTIVGARRGSAQLQP